MNSTNEAVHRTLEGRRGMLRLTYFPKFTILCCLRVHYDLSFAACLEKMGVNIFAVRAHDLDIYCPPACLAQVCPLFAPTQPMADARPTEVTQKK